MPCNLPLIFNIIKLYKEETNDDIKMTNYFRSNYIRILTREIKKCAKL